MTVCNEMKRRIDEADDRESLDLDIMRHTASCSDCRHFAGERTALRELLASTGRVSAPLNFDAMLQARLAETKVRRTPAWLNAAFYLRAGAATAALAVAVLVAQSSGLFTASQNQPIQQLGSGVQAIAPLSPTPAPSTTPKTADLSQDTPALSTSVQPRLVATGSPIHGSHRLRPATINARLGTALPPVRNDMAVLTDGGAILIRGGNGGRDITMPTVSVGAQPLMYVNAGRQPQSVHSAPVSF